MANVWHILLRGRMKTRENDLSVVRDVNLRDILHLCVAGNVAQYGRRCASDDGAIILQVIPDPFL